jgi:hypothetical protein
MNFIIQVGTLSEAGLLKFGSGKKCNFKMHSEDLKQALLNKPFFVMFVDSTPSKYQTNYFKYNIVFKS